MAVLVFLLALTIPAVFTLPEQGIFTKTFTNKDNFEIPYGVHKSMFNQSIVTLKIHCEGDADFKLSWMLRKTPCGEEYIDVEYSEERLGYYYQRPEADQFNFGYEQVLYIKTEPQEEKCNTPISLDPKSAQWQKVDTVAIPAGPAGNGSVSQEQTNIEEVGDEDAEKKQRKRRAAEEEPTSTETTTTKKNGEKATPAPQPDKNQIASTIEEGIYLFLLKIDPVGKLPDSFKLNVTITMKGTYGFLSAQDWPLLPFYGVMCGIYVVYGLIWLVLLFCNWRDLLRIQFWVGGVIFLGMLEKAVFFAEYESINASGQSVRGAVVFAELVSCMKRTLARMLVVIVSLGFGIVKPRLGPMLHRVLGMGALYMILGSVEGILRVTKHKSDTSKQLLLASIPLAVLDAAICWWVFTSLVQTTRTLRLRRNLVKLSLYRHFTNTLIFAVLASVAFMIWSIKQHKMVTCLTDWKELWVDDAFWHLLFSVILLVIMVLWRPTANNQRYAFSPLLDAADDEAEEPMISDAFDGMKMRGAGKQSSTSPHQRGEGKSKADEDLKWIEENIPTSVTDTALPSLLDSDEEIMTTKFEMSKME